MRRHQILEEWEINLLLKNSLVKSEVLKLQNFSFEDRLVSTDVFSLKVTKNSI